MNSDATFPVGQPVPRIDSFEVVEANGPQLNDEEQAWPVVTLQARSDSFEVVEPKSAGTEQEIVVRVRCAASATQEQVRAYAEQLRSAVENVRSPVGSFSVQISFPTQPN